MKAVLSSSFAGIGEKRFTNGCDLWSIFRQGTYNCACT